MDPFATVEWRAFLAAVREDREDDTARLAAADYLEENGKEEAASRVRMTVAFSRGLPLESFSTAAIEEGVRWAEEERSKVRLYQGLSYIVARVQLSPTQYDERLAEFILACRDELARRSGGQ